MTAAPDLRRIQEAITAALEPADAAAFLAGLRNGSVDRALGLRTATRFEQRDELIRETRIEFFNDVEKATAAKKLSDGLRQYERNSWPREKGEIACPARRVGKVEGRYWRIMSLVPRGLSADRIEKILG